MYAFFLKYHFFFYIRLYYKIPIITTSYYYWFLYTINKIYSFASYNGNEYDTDSMPLINGYIYTLMFPETTTVTCLSSSVKACTL